MRGENREENGDGDGYGKENICPGWAEQEWERGKGGDGAIGSGSRERRAK